MQHDTVLGPGSKKSKKEDMQGYKILFIFRKMSDG